MSAPREIKVLNSLTRRKETLVPLEPGKIRMYSCGPTVYGLIHIGNLRAALVADLFYRAFKRLGYDVTYVRNYTDVDDKIIQKGLAENLSAEAVAHKYTREVELDYAAAGLLDPTHKTTVTSHIAQIITMIEAIIKSGKAYVVQGEVLFSIEAFEGYGKLSHRNIEELQAGARVEVDSKKKNPLDFALWKPAKPGEPSWESPWGAGRPGWHIECSAMASQWLGPQIDVHHGGEDLIFPHHENEIAQSESASGKAPFVRYWLHNAFVTLAKEKMSKSIGNIFLAREFLTRYSGEFARYALLSVHYRSSLDFGPESIEQTLTGLHRIYEAKSKALSLMQNQRAMPDLRAESAWGEFAASCAAAEREIDAAYANDFNTPEALAALFTVIREFNRTLSVPLAEATPMAILGAQALIQLIEGPIGSVLGIGKLRPEKALEDLERIKKERATSVGEARPEAAEIEALILERLNARKQKDFARADQIRKDLETRGVILKDSPAGTTWVYR